MSNQKFISFDLKVLTAMMHHPHDTLFRRCFERLKILIEFLSHALPPALFKAVDQSRLTAGKDSFIDPKHRQHYSDLPVSAYLNGTSYKFYILVEHKSYYDRFVLLQLQKYMHEVWRREIETPGIERLSVIIPIIFYHGSEDTPPAQFRDLYKNPDDNPGNMEPFREYLLDFKAVMFSLTETDIEKLQPSPELNAVYTALKYGRTDLGKVLENLQRLTRKYGLDILNDVNVQDVWTYVHHVGKEEDSVIFTEFLDGIESVKNKEGQMTYAQMLMNQGKDEGLKEGIKEGIKAGIIETARNLKNSGCSVDMISRNTGLTIEEVKQL